MKLSEKGVERAIRWCCVDPKTNHTYLDLGWDALPHYEFEPDDFQGAVVLTVEEACEILDYLAYLHLRGGRDSFLKELEKCNRNLYERIEQVEMSKEST